MLLNFLHGLPGYLSLRVRQTVVFSTTILGFLAEQFSFVKSNLVRRMFWGRGSWYRSSFHILIVIFTVFALVTGLASKALLVEARQGLDVSYGQGASNDLLEQGGSIHTVLAVDPIQPDIVISNHIVDSNETLASIAKDYNVTEDTIRWANSDLISPFSNDIQANWTLKIPQINGVLYKVRAGQTVDDVANVTGGNRIDIIELNELVPPDYNLTEGQRVFVPNGNLNVSEVEVHGIPTGVFENPLSDPQCNGYSESRGFSSYHDGLDLARYPGCPIRAIATGVVTFAGWSGDGAGFNVRIDHGGGIVSKYYHGDGTIWVKVGERVQQGEPIMMMGTTGNSTGVHLHISLFKDGVAVDPAPYVPH